MNRLYTDKDIALDSLLPRLSFLRCDPEELPAITSPVTPVWMPDGRYSFAHEASIISSRGIMFAAWYNCPARELRDESAIRLSLSYDNGASWSSPSTVFSDITGHILYCPPVFGFDRGDVYLFVNEMVSADHIHSLLISRWDYDKECFVTIDRLEIPFKPNTNVCILPGGRFMIPGRAAAELDGFPDVPAVLLCDSGDMSGPWRMVKVASTPYLPDGIRFVHPEPCVIVKKDVIYLFCRDDERNVPLVYLSRDNGETWSEPYAHDIPFVNSKIYSLTLSDGRDCIIGNVLDPVRSRLVCLFSQGEELAFTSGLDIATDGPDFTGVTRRHYPAAIDTITGPAVIFTVSYAEPVRGVAFTRLK